MSAIPVDHSLEQFEMQRGQQMAQAQAQRLHDANMLQMAQAQQVARGQSPTSQNAAGGSPVTQSVLKAKALAMSSLDQDALAPDQKRKLQDLQNDPNTSYRDFSQTVEQLRQGFGAQQRQQNVQDRATATSARQQASLKMRQSAMNLSSLHQASSAAHRDAMNASKQLASVGINPDAPAAPGEDPQISQLRAQYVKSMQAADVLDKQHQSALAGLQSPDTQNESEDQTQGSDVMKSAGYAPGSVSISDSAPAQSQAPTGKVDTYSQPAIKPGSKGPLTADIAKQYLQRVGGDKQKARAAAQAEGWKL